MCSRRPWLPFPEYGGDRWGLHLPPALSGRAMSPQPDHQTGVTAGPRPWDPSGGLAGLTAVQQLPHHREVGVGHGVVQRGVAVAVGDVDHIVQQPR